jgi:hypothetical protein
MSKFFVQATLVEQLNFVESLWNLIKIVFFGNYYPFFGNCDNWDSLGLTVLYKILCNVPGSN